MAMNFGEALAAIRAGGCAARAGWNGKGMYVYLKKGLVDANRAYEPVVVLRNAAGGHQPGWTCAQADMLADDWSVVAPDPLED